MEAKAILRECPTSPRKMRLVVDLVRGKGVSEALNILRFSKQDAARRLEPLLLSAINNWIQKYEGEDIEEHGVFVRTIFADSGRMLKRLRTAPQGRGYRIRKRSNHVTMILDTRNNDLKNTNVAPQMSNTATIATN